MAANCVTKRESPKYCYQSIRNISYFTLQKSKAYEERETKNGENIKIIQLTVLEAMQIKTINSLFLSSL